MKSLIKKSLLTLSLLLISTTISFGQRELPALEFLGTLDEAPESQTVNLEISPEAQIEVSDGRLISAEISRGEDGRAVLTVAPASETLEAGDYEGSVMVIDREITRIPVFINIFPFHKPKECRFKKTKLSVLSRGSFDNFVGVEATNPSPYLISTGQLQRQYDDLGTNKRLFGDSYRLGGCRVCGVRVTVRAKFEGEIYDNDTLSFVVSDANNGTTYNQTTVAPAFAPMWTGQPSPFTFFREIQGSTLNPLITTMNAPSLDIMSQDDTAIDYTRVFIWRF